MIRAATPEDAQKVCEMTAEVSRHEGAPPPKPVSETFQTFGFGPDRAFECFVAEGSYGLVGHVVITSGFDVQEGCKTVWVADLFVAIYQRRKGIGRALMAHVCKRALTNGAGLVQWMVSPKNQEAAEFYRAIGSRLDRGSPMFLPREAIGDIAEKSP